MINGFSGRSAPSLYTSILQAILTEGKEVGPRGLRTKELSPVALEAYSTRERLFGHPHRRDVPIFTYIEALWILLGEDTPDRLGHYVKGMLPFLNPKTGKYDGAYGPRLRGQIVDSKMKVDQLTRVYSQLQKDPDSRRGVCSIHLADLDWNPESLDVPCTLTYQFLLRNSKLDMIVNMRSQDAMTGFIYDTGEFQWIQEIMASWLGLSPGKYYHFVGSLHLYEKDWEKARMIVDSDASWNVYDHVDPITCFLNYEDFKTELKIIGEWEAVCRKLEFENFEVEKMLRSKFFLNLAEVILAYNLRLGGEKDASEEIIRQNSSDLGYIYKTRWLKEQGCGQCDACSKGGE